MALARRYFDGLVIVTLALLCAVPFASCSSDDSDGYGGDAAEVRLEITAREESDLNLRAGGTEEGGGGEYIHTLAVFFTKDGRVVGMLRPDLSESALAKEGNLKAWRSDAFTLDDGEYMVYAFANMENYLDGPTLDSVGPGDDIAPLAAAVAADPASRIDLKENFIPMTAARRVTVGRHTSLISVGLDRMVSKVRLTLAGKPGMKIMKLTFGGYAGSIPLFEGAAPQDDFNTLHDIGIPGDSMLHAAAGGGLATMAVPEFYVNSTPGGHRLEVSVKTLEADGIVHEAKALTKRDELPRNSIYPLKLQFNDYGLDLELRCWLSPIGSLPVEMTVGFEPDTYVIRVPEGCQFEFTVKGVSVNGSAEGIADLKCSWDVKSAITGIEFDGPTAGVPTIKGHVAAMAGKEFSLQLAVGWSDGGAAYDRTYTVRLVTADLSEFMPARGAPAAGSFVWMGRETLNVFRR